MSRSAGLHAVLSLQIFPGLQRKFHKYLGMLHSGILESLGASAPQDLKMTFAVGFGLFLAGLFIFKELIAFYNAKLHPLCKFPGPAAATRSEAWLYKMTKSDFPEETFEKLHKEYSAFWVFHLGGNMILL